MNKYSKAVGPKLYPLLVSVLVLIALLLVNSLYLSGITFYQWLAGTSIQDGFYLWMFLLHLLLGLISVIPFIAYAVIHAVNTRVYKNKTAKRAGYLLLLSAIIVLLSGLLLTRFNADFEVVISQFRPLLYWLHVLLPIFCLWLFVLHRLSGRAINLKPGKWVFAISVTAVLGYIVLNIETVTKKNQNTLFSPSLSTTGSGDLIPAEKLNNNDFCVSCHEDSHQQWISSAHHFSSFNNPAYAFSVNNTKAALTARDGHAKSARFCASCHDPVLFFSGQFDDLTPAEETHKDAMAGITCSACHLVDNINSHQGNGAYQLSLPIEYPLTQAEYEPLRWVNQFLIKSKPDHHKSTYLKPLHASAEFCATCHKVSLPKSLNDYRWLRGQNHYDSFLLSGVSGHKVSSFYYPEKAKGACQDCHMKPVESTDISAKFDENYEHRYLSNHGFDVANTALRYLHEQPFDENSSALLKGSVKLDLLGIKQDMESDAIQTNSGQPLSIKPGHTYQLETVLKTQTLGHAFTQGTADSNQVWLELALYQDGELFAGSGGLNDEGKLNPFAYFVNSYVIDRNGNQITMRNPEDIFTTLYNHQIPPGAAAVIHYQFNVPSDLKGRLSIEAKLLYRKFNTEYYRAFMNKADLINDLPVVVIDQTSLELDPNTELEVVTNPLTWQRWNDYGIALLRAGEYKSALNAFSKVYDLGRTEGLINAVRVHLKEGQLDLAQQKLTQAESDKSFPYPWQLDYFQGRLHFLNGRIDQAINAFHQVLNSDYQQANEAGFDFSQDYEFLIELAQTYLQMGLIDQQSEPWIEKAQAMYETVLSINSESSAAYYGLFRVAKMTGDIQSAEQMEKLYSYYKIDDQVNDQAIQLARKKNPAADKAANRVVIYPIMPNKEYPLTLDQYKSITDIIVL